MKLTRKSPGKIQKVSTEISNFREVWFDLLLEVLHGHGGQVEELVGHLVRPRELGCHPDVVQDVVDLVEDLTGEEAAVLALDVLPEGHLQQGKAHVQGLDDVALAGQVMVPAGRLAPRHFALNLLKAVQHLRLEFLEGRVQHLTTN